MSRQPSHRLLLPRRRQLRKKSQARDIAALLVQAPSELLVGLTAEQAEELFTKVAGFASFGKRWPPNAPIRLPGFVGHLRTRAIVASPWATSKTQRL